MISFSSRNIKKFHKELLNHLEHYAYVRLWYKDRTYHATLTYYMYHESCIYVPRGNKYFRLGRILFCLGCNEKNNFISNLGKILRRRTNEKRCQNGSSILQELLQ